MKRKLFGTIALTVAIFFVFCNAFADAPELSDVTILYGTDNKYTWSKSEGWDHGIEKNLVQFNLNADSTINATIYEKSSGKFYTGVAASYNAESGTVVLNWNGVNYQGWHPAGSADNKVPIGLTLKIQAVNEDGTSTVSKDFTFYSGHSVDEHSSTYIPEINYDPIEESEVVVIPTISRHWYKENTVGLAGLELRELYPDLTSKWYNIVPVDLTQDGVQTYNLVVGNMFYIGKATVTVADGNVTVDYKYFGNPAYVNNIPSTECVAWFTDVADITTEFLDAPESDLAFGQAVSIAEELNGQDTALLFICNRTTYSDNDYFNNGTGLARYWRNEEPWPAYRVSLKAMLDAMK